jgi:polyhydroxyalkanoate synthesis regulator phasin
MEHSVAQMARRRTTPQRLPDAVREAVERTIQTTLGGAQQTRGRAQDAIDEVVQGAEAGAKTVGKRVREAIETTRPATSDDIRELREEIRALAARVEALERSQGGGAGAPAGKKTASSSKAAGRGPRAAGQKKAASRSKAKPASTRSAPGRKGSSRSPKS